MTRNVPTPTKAVRPMENRTLRRWTCLILRWTPRIFRLPDRLLLLLAAQRDIAVLGRREGGRRGASVPRSIANVRLESSIVNKVDPLGQTWRKSRPMGNRRLPIDGHQPRSQKAGHHPKGVSRPISDRNLTFAYELEAWWLAGCRHDQQQALSRWRDSRWINVPIDCLQRSLSHGRRSRAFHWAR
jgi:hypothetical protein